MAPSSQRHIPSRVCLAASAVLIVSFLTIGPALRGQTRADEHWVGAWATAATWRVEPGQPQPGQSGAAAAPAPPPAGAAPPQQPHLSDAPPHPLHQGPLPVGGQSPLQFHDQTLRQITHISIGGDQLRVVLTNVFGTVPLKIGASGRYVLVDRGWIAQGARRSHLPSVAAPAGSVSVAGRANVPPQRYLELGSDQGEGRLWQNLDIGRIAAATRLPLLPFIIEQTDPVTPADDLVRDWPPPDFGVAQNMSYMVQWYSLAALALVLWLSLNWRRRESIDGSPG